MNRENLKILQAVNILADVCVVVCAMMLAYFVRFVTFNGQESMSVSFYLRSALLISPLFLILYAMLGLYESQRVSRFIRIMEKLTLTSLICTGVLAMVFFIIRTVDASRGMLLFFLLLSVILSAFKRWVMLKYLRGERIHGQGIKDVVVIGSGSDAMKYIGAVNANKWMGFRVLGSVGSSALADDVPLLGDIDGLDSILSSLHADEAVAALALSETGYIKTVIDICEKNGVKLSLIPFYSDYMLSKPAIDEIGGVPLLNLRRIPLDNIICAMVKRLCDIIGSCVLILITLPFTLTAAVGTLITLGRPIIFRQERVGRSRRTFVMYKFRSMRPAAEESSRWSGYDRSRQTRFGTFLRRYAIDELPQLFNVLKGDMSLVGPRPELQKYVDIFKQSVPLYMVKHQVRPGITGWAQVNGYRGDTSIEERIRCDIHYIENWSLFFDIKIMLLTLFKFVNHGEKYKK